MTKGDIIAFGTIKLTTKILKRIKADMKHKLGLIGFSYLAGLICTALFRSPIIAAVICPILVLGLLITVTFKRKTAAAAVASALAASIVCGIYTFLVYEPLAAMDGETAKLNGAITEINRYSGDRASYTVNTEINGVSTAVTMFASDYGYDIGDIISFSGKLSLMRDNADFSEESYYRSKGIFLKVSSPSDIELIGGKFSLKPLIYGFSEHIGDRISRELTGDEGGLIKAMFLGDRSGLSYELSENIKRTGISHFTAVSGLHLTIIAHLIMLGLSFTLINRHRFLKYGILAALILLFMIFFRLSVSVIRAGIMLIIYYGAEPFMRKGSTVNSMGAAILLITLLNPYACLDAGLLLSVAGTFGIGVIAPALTVRFKRNALYGIKSVLTGTVCATVMTLPLSSVFFGGFSAVGIAANLLIYPLFFPALICMVFFTASGGYCGLFMLPTKLCAKGMIYMIKLLGEFRYAYVSIRYEIMIPICIISVLFVCLIYSVFRGKCETLISAALSVFVIFGSYMLIGICDKKSAVLLLYSDGSDACVIVEKEDEAFVCASGDSEEIAEYIDSYIKDRCRSRVNLISLIRSNHNNLAAFEAFPCDRLIVSGEYGEEKYSADKITAVCEDGCVSLVLNGVSVTVSPAGKAADSDISVIYGYKKKLPDLDGIAFCSSSRIIGGKDFINIYFEPSEYLITPNGFLEKINCGEY